MYINKFFLYFFVSKVSCFLYNLVPPKALKARSHNEHINIFLLRSNVPKAPMVPSKIHYIIPVLKSTNDFYTEIKNSTTTLEDLGGIDYIKEDICDLIDFLKNPEKYKQIGAKLPKGILLTGPPGTGKTKISSAIAGEAGVPFFATTGSSFLEIYVGMGSKRIKEIFRKAALSAPSIIFIDEIDAIGNKRSMSASKNEERESTLNQLLAEIDGIIESNVIVIGATNFPEMLDSALTRSGRLEKKIYTILPDLSARYKILSIHTKTKIMDNNIDLYNFAKQMVNLNGADISMIINNAAIKTCRNNETSITSNRIQEAYNTFLFGSKLLERDISDNIKLLTSVHETAHAIVSNHFNFDKVIYISIIPNTKGAQGITIFRAIDEFSTNNIYTKEYLFAKVATLLAGRIGEQIIFGDNKITTGAVNDFREARNLVSKIVNEFSMTNEILPSDIKKKEKEILEFMYIKAKKILYAKKDILEYISQKLYIKNEFYENDFNDLVNNYIIYEKKKNTIKTIIMNNVIMEDNIKNKPNIISINNDNINITDFIIKNDKIISLDDCIILTNDEISK